MKKIKQEITIDASQSAIWSAITEKENYEKWAVAFTPGSYFEGGWNTGDSIRFLIVNKKGLTEGMVSEIAESRFPEFISLRHLGYIMDGVDDTTSDEIRAWAPSYENYTLEVVDSKSTKFILEMDVVDEYHDMMVEMWQKAMVLLKDVAEKIKS